MAEPSGAKVWGYGLIAVECETLYGSDAAALPLEQAQNPMTLILIMPDKSL